VFVVAKRLKVKAEKAEKQKNYFLKEGNSKRKAKSIKILKRQKQLKSRALPVFY